MLRLSTKLKNKLRPPIKGLPGLNTPDKVRDAFRLLKMRKFRTLRERYGLYPTLCKQGLSSCEDKSGLGPPPTRRKKYIDLSITIRHLIGNKNKERTDEEET